jgi:hypothetical protein
VEWFAHDPAKTGEPQTHRNYAWRDYGNRIGVWRLFDLLDELKLPAPCAVRARVVDAPRRHCRFLRALPPGHIRGSGS